MIVLNKDTTLYAHFDRISTVPENNGSGSLQYELYQNYPNPFNQQTTINFMLAEDTDVIVTIYNTNGQLINRLGNLHMGPGSHSLSWDGKDQFGNDVTSGVFFYQLRTKAFSQIRKMLLLK